MTPTRRAAALALACLLLAGACNSADPATPATGAPTGAPTDTTPASPTPKPTPAPTPLAPGTVVKMDESLLAMLPATVGGAPVTSEADSFAQGVQDTSFVANVDRAAFFVVVVGGDLASGAVAHLRPGVYSDGLWKDWRTTYDDGSCTPAGGVLARGSSSIGGREVFVTTCAGGLRVYQVWLSGPGVIVSLVSFGDKRFGEQLMAGLRG
jgi:hypothetical protein